MIRKIAYPSLALLVLCATGAVALFAFAVYKVSGESGRVERNARAGVEIAPVQVLLGSLARKLVSEGDDITYWRAVAAYKQTFVPHAKQSQATQANQHAEELLLKAGLSGDKERRSQALNLLGVLQLREAQADPTNVEAYAKRAFTDFRSSIVLDERNDDAKQNLELLLHQDPKASHNAPPKPQGGRLGEQHHSSKGGAGQPGSGY